MEDVRKGYWKWILVALSAVHVILLLVFVFWSIHQYAYDFVSYTGITKADSEDVQTFFEGDMDAYYDEGQEILKDAGYGYSGPLHLENRFVQTMVPLVVLCIMLDIGIGVYVVVQHKNEKKNLAVLKHELDVLLQEKEILLEDAERETVKISRFEENLYHQLKTPVTGLKLTLEEMDGKGDVSLLQHAKWETDVLSRLISLLLRDRQVSENKVRYHYAVQDFSMLVLEALQETEPLRKVKEKSILQSGTDQELLVRCDGVWMKEAIVVLLENAIESEAKTITCNIKKANGHIILSLLSQGVSIGEERMNHLFERFYTMKDNHYGIGLHMARHIVLEHHGNLVAKNNEEGVLFQLSLPLTDSDIFDVTGL